MAGVTAILLLEGCSSGEASGDGINVINVDETLTTENLVANEDPAANASATVSQSISHNYDFHEGDLYGYIGAVSEEDQKRGKAAGEVFTFRYSGFWDSVDHIEQVDAYGRTLSYNECSRPCVAIRSRFYGRIERIAFNPASIIGAAFQDAMNGMLETPPVSRIPTPSPSPSGSSTAIGDEQTNGATITENDESEETVPAE